jgi:hypothetical protein
MTNNNIESWYDKNTKLYKYKDFQELNNYLKIENNEKIEFSSDYIFYFYNLDKINYTKLKLRPENVFKLNFLIIIKKIKKYFKEEKNLKINIYFEKSGIIDSQLKKIKCTYKHDVYIKIEHDDNIYSYREIGLEFFEKKHDRIKDFDKEISSNLVLDSYLFYKEDDKNYYEFIKKSIYEIFLNITSILNNKYILSKILYFENYKCLSNIKSDTELFNKIINWKKDNNLDFQDFFEELTLKNPENSFKLFKYDEFLEYIEDNYNIKIKFNNNIFCEYKYFIDIINYVDPNCSTRIRDYRKIYTKIMDILLDASDKIIQFTSNSNKSKANIPKYINNLLSVHIQNFKDNYIIEKAYNNLINKFNKYV